MTKVLRAPKDKNQDLFTFVANDAMQKGKPIPIQCTCGGETVFYPPFEQDVISCSACGASIGLTVVEGDPGYVLTQDKGGNKQLAFVQGGSAKPPEQLSKAEREKIIRSFDREPS